MTATEQYFCHLLSAHINHREADPIPEDVSVQKVISLSKIHAVSGIIGHMLSGNESLPADLREKLKKDALITVMRSSAHIAVGETVINALKKEGIFPIPFKGSVTRSLYPIPELRTFGDIDMLISPDHMEKAHNVMMRLGFKHTDGQTGVWGYQSPDGFVFEIHNRLSGDKENLPKAEEEFFAATRKNIVRIGKEETLNSEYHFAYCIWHLTKHLSSVGAGIRMFMDIAVMTKYGDISDWDKVAQILENMGILQSAKSIFFLCKYWFGTNVPQPFITDIDDDTLEMTCHYVLSAGTYGYHGRTSGATRIRNEMGRSNDTEAAKKRVVIRMLFPSIKYLREMYPWYGGSKIALPFVWIYRYFDALFNRRKGSIKAFNQIMSGGEKEREEYRMLEKLGWQERKS